MQKSRKSDWELIWNNINDSQGYAYQKSRYERAIDKINLFCNKGVKFQENQKILEAGCGDGSILIELIKRFKVDGYGIDISETALSLSKEFINKIGYTATLKLGDVHDIPYDKNIFDVVISLGVIEHFDDSENIVREMYRVLKPQGILILMTPNSRSLGVADRKIKQLFGKWKFGYQTEYTRHELKEFCKSTGFTIIDDFTVVRNTLPEDTHSFKIITRCDRLLSKIFKDWGFYSYVIAMKGK